VAETGELPTAGELRQLTLDAAAEKETEAVLAFLSGNVRPDDRSVIIDALYGDAKDNSEVPDPLLDTSLSVILISTSVVEAGVDISFNTVFRDYAPIPNIVQSGGRCNRAFDGEIGEVVIWRLAEPENGSSIPSLVIHGGSGGDTLPLLQATGQVLQEYTGDQPRIDEAVMISDVVSDFYELLFEGPLDPGSRKLVTDVESVAMSELENEHMIDDIEDYEDVIIGLTDKERIEFFDGDINIRTVSKYPGAQVSTDPESWEQEVSIGNSRYLVLDGRNSSYDPIFGVR
jgi:CRISPR-associated endonuclease/helicase Cas3/CRISPR-associated endonuclease Cas3-HD